MNICKTLVATTLCAAGCVAEAALRTAAPFGDGMVLQRGMKVPVWGGADADQEVVVTFAGQRKCAKADAAGVQAGEREEARRLAAETPRAVHAASRRTSE